MAKTTGTSDIWERTKKILQKKLDIGYQLTFRGTFLAEDLGKTIVVDVVSAPTVSAIARKHHTDIFDALAEVGRPRTMVRLRTNLSFHDDDPDWYVRDLVPPVPKRGSKAKAAAVRSGR